MAAAAALLKLPSRSRRPKSFRRRSPSTLPTSTAGRLSPPPPPPGSTCVRHRRPPLIALTSAVACLQLRPLLHPTSIGPLHPNTAALYAMTVPRAPCSRSGLILPYYGAIVEAAAQPTGTTSRYCLA